MASVVPPAGGELLRIEGDRPVLIVHRNGNPPHLANDRLAAGLRHLFLLKIGYAN
jgi:hypothetical protein